MTQPDIRATLVCCCLMWACDSDGVPQSAAASTADPTLGPVTSSETTDEGAASAEPTCWRDMAPLFAAHCMRCQRAGGIAPLRLDDYVQAKAFSKVIEQVTAARTMPPWSVESDGCCGDFANGRPEIVHHVAVMWVDPNAPADLRDSKAGAALSNPDQLRALDDESPDRGGWRRFGMAHRSGPI
jgi:hypothetical protein